MARDTILLQEKILRKFIFSCPIVRLFFPQHCDRASSKLFKLTEMRPNTFRVWREVARITSAGLFELPSFFRNGLYKLHRELPDAEVILAFARCRAWYAKA